MIALLLTLTSCAAKAPPPPASFSAQAEISFGEKQFSAAVQQQAPGALILCFTAPEELAGLELALEGETAALHFKGLQHTQPLGAMPGASFAAFLNRVLLRLAQPGGEGFTRVPKGGWTFRGEINGLRYSAKIAEDGSLERLEVPAIGLRIDIIYQSSAL